MYEFIKDNINSDRPEKEIPRHLPQVAVLYYLFNGRPQFDFYTAEVDGKFGFYILSENDEDIQSLRDSIDKTPFTVYGHTFLVCAKVIKNKVFVYMT